MMLRHRQCRNMKAVAVLRRFAVDAAERHGRYETPAWIVKPDMTPRVAAMAQQAGRMIRLGSRAVIPQVSQVFGNCGEDIPLFVAVLGR
jgi:hypothetical protein